MFDYIWSPVEILLISGADKNQPHLLPVIIQVTKWTEKDSQHK